MKRAAARFASVFLVGATPGMAREVFLQRKSMVVDFCLMGKDDTGDLPDVVRRLSANKLIGAKPRRRQANRYKAARNLCAAEPRNHIDFTLAK